MSRRVLPVALVLLLAARTTLAQSASSLEARLRLIQNAQALARARLAAFDDSVRKAREAFVEVNVAPFRMRVDPEMVDLARDGASMAARDLAWTGHAADLITARQIVVRRIRGAMAFGRENVGLAALLSRDGVEVTPIEGSVAGAATIRTWLVQIGTQVLASAMPQDIRQWLDVQPRFDTLSTEGWTNLRVALVSSPASIARACYDKDMRACGTLLGLTPTRDPVHEWFDSRSRREVVRRLWARSGRTPAGLDGRCVDGDDSACVEVLGGGSWAAHVNAQGHRMALLQLAIQTGGPGAMERLYAPAASLNERLEHVSGVSTDSLTRAWRARVHDTRLPYQDLTGPIAGLSIAWVGVFGALALRSSRWR